MAAPTPHVVMIPYPAQGHINPSLAFAHTLAAAGLPVTFITTTALAASATISSSASVAVHHISDGYECVAGAETVDAYQRRLRANLSRNLAEFLDERHGGGGWGRVVIIYDSVMPWILDIARERGMIGASFFTQSCGACAVYYHLGRGSLRFPYEEGCTSSFPGLPSLGVEDLPSFSHLMESQGIGVEILSSQFSNLERADWVFFNTFEKLESPVIIRRTTAIDISMIAVNDSIIVILSCLKHEKKITLI